MRSDDCRYELSYMLMTVVAPLPLELAPSNETGGRRWLKPRWTSRGRS